jgi:bifunctional DNase/RNase
LKKSLLLLSVVLLVIGTSTEISWSEEETGLKEMKVMRVRIDPLEGKSVVILKDMDEKRVIPIWIGISEANAIALEINGVAPPRPMTHDLMKNILEGLHARVHHILIHDVRQNIIYARIILKLNGKKIPVDARPSDAIALALRVKAQIFVTDDIYRSLSLDLKQDQGNDSELSV